MGSISSVNIAVGCFREEYWKIELDQTFTQFSPHTCQTKGMGFRFGFSGGEIPHEILIKI